MDSDPRSYPDQFATCDDLLQVIIPRMEIVAEMAVRGERAALNDVCLAIAVVADAIANAQSDAAGIRHGAAGGPNVS